MTNWGPMVQLVAARQMVEDRVLAYLTGPVETADDRQRLVHTAELIGAPVTDRATEWVWDAEALLVLPGWEGSSTARCDVVLAEDCSIHMYMLSVPSVKVVPAPRIDTRSA